MSRHRFEAYLDKVFGFSDLVSALPEGRQFPQHPWKKVFAAVFLGAAMQIPSLLQIEAECGGGALAKRIDAALAFVREKGVTFHWKEKDAADFDENGVYRYRFLVPASTNSTCHSFELIQDGVIISQ